VLASFVGVAALATFLYIWGLERNGYANQYYAAAVLSMTESPRAFFYAALDAVGFITVDKPPFAFWVQALAAKLFGFSPWTILLPQALAGLACVLLLYRLARPRFGATAATLAALVLTLTPITVAVNRDNLPDAVLVLLMVGAAAGTLAAQRRSRLAPLLLGAALLGLAFNTKMLQAYIAAPALVLTYGLTAPGSWRRRLGHLLAAGAVMLVVSGVWLTVVDAIPADQRPYIGGSSTNSVLDLVLGYNGLGRIFGNERGFGGGPANAFPNLADVFGGAGFGGGRGGPGFGGPPGWTRLLDGEAGSQIGWLLPLAIVGLVVGLAITAHRPRTDSARAWYVLWGGWLATHFVVFSFAAGIFHPYYTTAMAPAIAALVGPGLLAMWRLYRGGWRTAWVLPLALVATAAWSLGLLSETSWPPWLHTLVGGAAGVAVASLLLGRLVASDAGRRVAVAGCAAGLVAILAGPAAWASTPLQNPLNGTMPSAGPTDVGRNGGFLQRLLPQSTARDGRPDGFGRDFSDGQGDGRTFAGGQPSGGFGSVGGRGLPNQPRQGDGGPAPTIPGFGNVPGGFGRPGGQIDQQMLSFLETHRGQAAYLVAVNGAQAAAPLILATHGEPVMAMGGFSGGDPAPTTAQLESLVQSGALRFILEGGGGFGRGGNGRTPWLQANCTVVDPSQFGGQGAGARGEQLYDCAPRG
jgi:4-amino-4-deoxy-L-arabinose transferase-like glycosyltransferase